MLKVHNLYVYYDQLKVLDGISIDINEGELVALVGNNGAGKTTLLMTICGIKKQASGNIQFMEERLDKLPPDKIFRLGLVQVPQDRCLFTDMTVLENLKQGAYRSPGVKHLKENMERVYNYFPILAKRKKQPAGTLSGGEQQMLTFGRALMADPRLLVIDEPSSGLSPIIIDMIADIISNLHKQGLTMLLVEQNVELALELADRGYVLENGRIAISGNSFELLNSETVKKAYLGL